MKTKPEPVFVEASVKRDQIRDKTIQAIKESFPFVGSRVAIDVEDIKVHPADISPLDHKNALMRAKTLSEPVRGTLVLKDAKTGKVRQKIPKFNLLQLPYFTDHHSFVIDGNTYNVSNQLRMKPGVYTRRRRNQDLEASFNLAKGRNFRMNMDQEKGYFNLEYGSTKIPLYPVLNKLGVSDAQISKTWNPELVRINKEAYAKRANTYIDKLYDKLVPPSRRKDNDDKIAAIKGAYQETALDPYVTQRTLGKRFNRVDPEALLSASNKLLRAYNEKIDFDERDSLAYKHLKSVDDFIAERIKLESRNLKNKFLSKIERGRGDIESIPTSPFTKSIRQFLSTSQLSSNPTQINPIEILDHASRVTSLGEGGISSERAIPEEAHRLHTSHIGVLDPIRTPETSRAGIDLRTAMFTSRDSEGNLYTHFHDAKTGRIKEVPVDEAVDKVIAFPEQELRGKVDVIANGRIQSMPASKVDYQVPSWHAMYSATPTLIPFIDSIDTNRQIMGAKMMTQALPLVNSEPRLIQVTGYPISGRKDTMEREWGKLIIPRAPTSGTVSAIKDGFIHIKPRKEKTAAEAIKVPFYNNFPLASKTYLNHNLKIKPGDEVKAGQILADSQYVKDGQLSLGVNLNTAYLPVRGRNSNDAVIVSESAANKLTSRHMYRLGKDLEADTVANNAKHKSYFGNKYTKEIYDKLDSDGIIKPGMQVNKGDLLVAAVQKSELSPEAQMLGKLHKSLIKPFRDDSVTWDKEYPGKIVDVAKAGRKIRLTVKTDEPLQIGDKLSGSYGNKGIVSDIIPNDQMIQDAEGNPVDVAISSASVVSRINPAQILETSLAKVARKIGKPIAVENFSDRDNVQYVKQQLKKHGVSEKETVYDPITGKKIKDVLVGPQYTLKLFKSTDTNYSARGVEDYDSNLQPTSGGPKGAKSVGRLAFNALLAHDARNILKESAVLKSQKNDEWWRAYQLGLPLPALNPSFAYDKFGAMLAGSGVKMDKSDNTITLGPLTDRDVSQMTSGPVKNPLFVRAKDLRPERGGLFDPVLTGGTTGTRWSHIDLAEPIVNPVFERPVKTLLGMKQAEYDRAVREEGGREIKKRLSKIDLEAREKALHENFKNLKGVSRDNAIKEMKYIEALKRNDIRPEDAWVISKIPVIPPTYRPIVPGKRGDLQVSDANYLYRDTMLANDLLSKSKKLPPSITRDARKHLYESTGALYGLREPISPQLQGRGSQGFISRIAGTGRGPKYGFFHQKLLKKRQDLSGRGTISPDPTLAMHEFGLPEESGWEMYRPFITKGLVQRGYKAIDAKKMIEDRHPLAKDVLLRETQERPVLINRAPSLLRYNVLAAYPKLVPGKTVRVHEMLAPIMSGDFDGDAVQMHLPVSREAVEEARNMTLPNMLISDQEKFTLSKAAPQQEAVTGIYMATSAQPKGKKRIFKNKAEAMAAYNRGEIDLSTPVEIKK